MPAPLAHLNDEGNVRAARHFRQLELPVHIRQSICDGRPRSGRAAKVTRRAGRDRSERGIRDVDERVVNWVEARGIVNGSAQACSAGIRTVGFDLALNTRATRARTRANVGSAHTTVWASGAAIYRAATAIANLSAVFSTVRSSAAGGHTTRVEAEVRKPAAPADTRIRAAATFENATATVTNSSAVLPPCRLA